MAALYSLPSVEETMTFRWISCIVYALIVFAILYTDQVKSLGVVLGVVTVSMVILFLILALHLGLDVRRLAKSLFSVSIPSGSINIVLSLVGTTSIGFNLFLGSEMARGKDLSSAQRGIVFSTFMAFIISVLILIVGDGTHAEKKGAFTVVILIAIIERLSGKAGRWIFGIGFIAAALSSMLAVPLGAAMTADSFLTVNDEKKETIVMNVIACNIDGKKSKEESELGDVEFSSNRPFPRKYYIGLMFAIVIVATVVIGANTPRLLIILIAQVKYIVIVVFFHISLDDLFY